MENEIVKNDNSSCLFSLLRLSNCEYKSTIEKRIVNM